MAWGSRVAVDDEFVYWTEQRSGRVMKVPKEGGEPVAVACGQEGPVGLALDDTFVYWTNSYDGTVMKAPK